MTAVGLLAAIACASATAQATFPYRDRTGNREIRILMFEEPTAGGSIVHSRMSDGEMHDVEIDETGATLRYHVVSPARRIDYTVTREANTLLVTGTFGGSPLSRTIVIDSRPWYEALERSLRIFVAGGGAGQVEFWIVHPWEARAYLLEAEGEGYETVTVNDRQEAALRVRVRPVGFLHYFWSALYWYRRSDELFVRYEAVRGFPGTPRTVVEYMGKD